MDDINDVAYQLPPVQRTAASGTYSRPNSYVNFDWNVSGRSYTIPTDGEPGFVNVPGWVNPNTGVTEYIPAGSLQSNLGQIQN